MRCPAAPLPGRHAVRAAAAHGPGMRRALRGLSAALGQLAENAPAARLRAASSLAPEQPPAVTRLTFPAGLAATAHSPSRPPLQPPALEPHTALSPPVDSAADERAAEADSRAASGPGEASPRSSQPARHRRPPPGSEQSLRNVPGIGPAAAEKLRNNGIVGEDSLKQMFQDDAGCDPDKMAKLLREKGIRFNKHAEQAVAYIRSLVDARPGLTICVEGNISAGKSTFLNTATMGNGRGGGGGGDAGGDAGGGRGRTGGGPGGCAPPRRPITVVPEPVDRWTSIPGLSGTDGLPPTEYNLLQEFYSDPRRWGFTFQNWVFFTRFMQERDSAAAVAAARAGAARAASALGGGKGPGGGGGGGGGAGGGWGGLAGGGGSGAWRGPASDRLIERSVFSDRLVFVQAMAENNSFSGLEMAVYQQWWDFMLEDRPSLVPDGFIYLRAQPGTCERRMRRRDRREESAVPLSYLEVLHAKHENWFQPGRNSGGGRGGGGGGGGADGWAGGSSPDAAGVGGDTFRARAAPLAPGSLEETTQLEVEAMFRSVIEPPGRGGVAGLGGGALGGALGAGDGGGGGGDRAALYLQARRAAEAVRGMVPASLHGSIVFMQPGAAPSPPASSSSSSSAFDGALSAAPGGRFIAGLPALVLNCDEDVDLSEEEGGPRAAMAAKVQDFYSFVETWKEATRGGRPGAWARGSDAELTALFARISSFAPGGGCGGSGGGGARAPSVVLPSYREVASFGGAGGRVPLRQAEMAATAR